MLRADQSAHPHAASLSGIQSGAVARAPYHALAVGWHQFAVTVSQFALRREGQQGVVERTATRTGINPLVDSHNYGELQVAGGLAKRLDLESWHVNTILPQSGENTFGGFVVPQRSVRPNVEARRLTWEPSLPKGH